MSALIDAPVPAGWARGHFGFATAPADGGRCGVDGWTRGCWGVAQWPHETANGEWLALASLTHLGCGYRFALFTDARDAAEAADIADRICDWSTLTPALSTDDSWREKAQRVFAAWEGFDLFRTSLRLKSSDKAIWARDLRARPDATVSMRA